MEWKSLFGATDQEAAVVTLVGGKAVGLARLSEAEKQDPEVRVPRWVVLPAFWYTDFVSNNFLKVLLEQLDEVSESWVRETLGLEWTHSKLLPVDLPDTQALNEKAAEVREAFRNSHLPKEFQGAISEAYKCLYAQADRSDLRVAIRSSATAEDLEKAAFAGRQDSFLNVADLETVCQKVKSCLASLFTDRAVEYRAQQRALLLKPKLGRYIKQGKKQKEAIESLLSQDPFFRTPKIALAIVLQEMIEAKAAGTIFTVDEGTGFEGISVNANWGFGETVVGGLVTGDSWLFDKLGARLLRWRRGPKTHKSVAAREGTILEEIAIDQIYQSVFDEQTARQLVQLARRVSQFFPYRFLDLEYAIDQQDKIWLLQARAETYWSHGGLPIMTVDPEVAKRAQIIYKGGMTGAPGAAHGQIIVVPDLQEAQQRLKPGHLLVTLLTHNQWSSLMVMVAGAVTEVGNEGCHTAVTMRELGRPALVGAREVMVACTPYQGKEATLDACLGQIFQGRLPLVPAKKVHFKDQSQDEHVIPPDHIFYDESGRQCIGKPGYPVCPLQFDLYRICHEWAAQLFGKHCESVLVEGRHCIPLDVFAPTTQKIKRAPLRKIEKIANDWEATIKEYLSLAQQFVWEPQSVRRMFDLMNRLNGYMSIGFNLYRTTERRARKLLRRRSVPKAFRFEIRRAYFDKETETMRQTRNFWRLLKDAKEVPGVFAGSPEEVASSLQKDEPRLYQEILEHARTYKVTKGTDFAQSFTILPVIAEIQQCLRSNIPVPEVSEERIRSETVFFPDDERFNRTMRVAAKLQLLRDDSHHFKVRGQWSFREEMMRFAQECVSKGLLPNPQAIFDLSVEEVIFLSDRFFNL